MLRVLYDLNMDDKHELHLSLFTKSFLSLFMILVNCISKDLVYLSIQNF